MSTNVHPNPAFGSWPDTFPRLGVYDCFSADAVLSRSLSRDRISPMLHHPFLVALAAVIAVNVVVVVLAIATGIRRGLGGAWEP